MCYNITFTFGLLSTAVGTKQTTERTSKCLVYHQLMPPFVLGWMCPLKRLGSPQSVCETRHINAAFCNSSSRSYRPLQDPFLMWLQCLSSCEL